MDHISLGTNLENLDHHLIDPSIYHLPPEADRETRILVFTEALEFRLQEALEESLLEEDLPPSTVAEYTPQASDNGWGTGIDTPWSQRRSSCWCEDKEICTCDY